MSTTDHLSPIWSHLTHMAPVRGEGIYLYDSAGRRYVDFTCGIGVTNTGHCHPRVVKAIQAQAEKLLFAQMNVVINPLTAALSDALNAVTPPSIDSFFFSNSGAEATEGAVKLARHATARTNIIVFQGSFHGRTAQTMAMTTSKTVYKYKYHPLPSGIVVAPFPYSYYLGMSDDEATAFCLKQLDYLLKAQTSPDDTAAIIIEPVLGEGGYVPAPVDFLKELRALCSQHGIMFVADEVQTGFGRTGKLFCFEHAGIEPDIVIMAKGLGSGLPISGVAAPRAIMERWVTGSHGGTYGGGSAVVMAAALETVNVIVEEKLADNAAARGATLMSGLRELQAEFPVIGDVRGRGLMVGVEFTTADGKPDKLICKAAAAGCLKRGLLLLTCGTYENVVRWIPPLIVTDEQVEEALAIFRDALGEAVDAAASTQS
ncbi:MAG: aspartate aminotransferase family protein [Chloroflexi bacterium]|nr:aspartate aminotransferase family protein [Chloroflexota bacterium]MBV6436045.1 5-aminovalerate aminotransferase DavT [Anaerolineae bacterium]MDL1917071.1 aspartate aminotransferase family protein [Anaerolineae bacterium CFX4]OQY85071.1 MAG: aspartate aminotransferase family protein [Anaerolineae bacterium UTCFX5]MCC6565474.1 aspartate aminotransferase family protein [Chloroflexota bacterium]